MAHERIETNDVTMIEFRADQRVAFAVDFVAGEKFDVRTRGTAIDLQLLLFDRDIFLRGPDLGSLGQRARQGGIEIGVTRFVLQSPDRFELRFAGGAGVDPAEIAQVQIRIAQIGLRLHQLRLFVGERDLGAAGIQRANRPGAQAFALAFQFLAQHADRLFADKDFLAIQKQFVKREAHIHRHAIGHGLELVLLLGQVELGDRHLIAGGAAGVKILHHPDRGAVVIRAQARRFRVARAGDKVHWKRPREDNRSALRPGRRAPPEFSSGRSRFPDSGPVPA